MTIPVEHVLAELQKLSGAKHGSKFTMILCPYHGEKTASGRILHDYARTGVGRFKCYGCGKSAPWNELAVTLGLEQYGKKMGFHTAETPKLNEELHKNKLLPPARKTVNSGSSDEERYFDLDEYNADKAGIKNNEWRGFPISFLSDVIGAKLLYKWNKFYLWLPIKVNQKLKGYINAQIVKSKDKKVPSYINAPGSWVLTHGLFPFDQAIKLMRSKGLSTIVLVEGPRDALRLLHAGIPAVAILGTQSWSDSKARLLEFSEVSTVILLMDGDVAGKTATRFIATGKRDSELVTKPLRDSFTVNIIRLWNISLPAGFPDLSIDPGNMPDKFLLKLNKMLTWKTLMDQQQQTSPVSVRTNTPLLVATIEKSTHGSEWVKFTFIEPDREKRDKITGTYHLYTEMRKAIIKATGNESWSIRYASRVVKENLHFLHSSNTLQVIIDSLLPYRDPIRDMFNTGHLEFQIIDSQAYFFKTKNDASKIIEEDKRLKAIARSAHEASLVAAWSTRIIPGRRAV